MLAVSEASRFLILHDPNGLDGSNYANHYKQKKAPFLRTPFPSSSDQGLSSSFGYDQERTTIAFGHNERRV